MAWLELGCVVKCLPCRTALHLACAKGLGEMVLHLAATCKADTNIPDAEGATPLHRVCVAHVCVYASVCVCSFLNGLFLCEGMQA